MPEGLTAPNQQWYETDPQLMVAEVEAMRIICPDARYGFLPDGRMFWTVRLIPDIDGKRTTWTLLVVYDEDHPNRRWGGSIRVYPVRPSYDDMVARVKESDVQPKRIAHTLRDDEGRVWLATSSCLYPLPFREDIITSAATCVRGAYIWINYFEWGLRDQAIWSEFCSHRNA